jgi:hypothetical protein
MFERDRFARDNGQHKTQESKDMRRTNPLMQAYLDSREQSEFSKVVAVHEGKLLQEKEIKSRMASSDSQFVKI